ncbi:hypothetical protein TNCT_600711 [Trichonephila clavata]|uniref:Uncharacterized protein n=1 Tax=Trichonephila clavata TaxID=2740835 RepID=A0A8X6KMP6_TRICU|nr:hypothetical protein TNCT_600711 [Trichonephila clavata]
MKPKSKSPSVEHHAIQFSDTFRFFIIKTPETFSNVSPFLIEKAISSSFGEVKSIRKIRSGDLFLEVSSSKQSDRSNKTAEASSYRHYRCSSHQSEFFTLSYFAS